MTTLRKELRDKFEEVLLDIIPGGMMFPITESAETLADAALEIAGIKSAAQRREEAEKRIAEQRAKKGDLVDAFISQIPATQKQIRLEGIQSRLAVAFNFNCTWDRWERFIKYADKQEQDQGQTVEVFASWLKSKPGFDIGYWPPSKMLEVWPQAFTIEEDRPEYKPFIPQERKGVPNPGPKPRIFQDED